MSSILFISDRIKLILSLSELDAKLSNMFCRLYVLSLIIQRMLQMPSQHIFPHANSYWLVLLVFIQIFIYIAEVAHVYMHACVVDPGFGEQRGDLGFPSILA